jgi:hypothetical protein
MKRSSRRQASILLLVLIIVPVLALAAYSLSQWMRAEASGSIAHGRSTQALWLAHSGVEHLQAFLSDPANLSPGAVDLSNDPSLFSRILVAPEYRSTQGFFSVIGRPLVPQTTDIRYGLVNESAKIPLHRRRVLFQGNPAEQRERLSALPNMTPTLADAILDWIDADGEPREGGAEADYYLALPTPYSPRNAPPRTIGELLLVRGVTPHLLYGEDANLDGILNPNENDGDRTWPPDNADGVLDLGWFPYLTIYSAADNNNPDGEPKIDLNGDLAGQREALVELFGREWFDFVTQYKTSRAGKKMRAVTELINAKVDPPKGQGNPSGGSPGGLQQFLNSAGGEKQKPLESPWKESNLSQYLDKALTYLTVDPPDKNKGVARGRIDVTAAPFEVLRALPGIKEATAQAMASAAQGRTPGDASPAWLLLEGIVTLDEFRKIEQLITTQNRVFRVESVGYFSSPGPVARVEAIIDATASPARVLFRRELTGVGSAYPQEMLVNGTTSTIPTNPGVLNTGGTAQ